jgi:caa(3)-type oxidase subunit IV
MVDANATAGHGHAGPKAKVYLVIGGALGVFTAVSFIINSLEQGEHPLLTANQGFFIILAVAIVKATLVVAYFMHVVWDWKKVLFMIIPALILGAMMMFVLMPDIVEAWHFHPNPSMSAANVQVPEPGK